MGLAIKDILLLDYFDGKPAHHKVPDYKYKLYGEDADARISTLRDGGWIRYSKPKETLSMMPDKALSDLLIRAGLSGEGTHAELVGRVMDQVPETTYAYGVPKIYVLTREGKAEVGRHMAYVLNIRENYGLTEGEIGESQSALAARGESYTARGILYRAFHQKIDLYTMAGEWSKLRNMYYTVANFYLRIKKTDYALPYLYLVFFMDMSGMGNRNNLVPYENLFPTQKGIILLMDEMRQSLHMTMADVKSAFLSSIARMAPPLPFSYFSPQVMASMLIERLEGRSFNPTHYICDRCVPDPNAKSYHYVPYGRSEARPVHAAHRVAPKKVKPPVLHMPTFTPPPPFLPTEKQVNKPEPKKMETPKAEKTEKKTGLLGRLRKLF